MKDPSIPDPRERKKFMFYDTEKRQVDLRVRLRYDGLNQSEFFRAMITGYLEKDELIMEYMHRYKKKYEKQGKRKREKSKNLIVAGKELEKQFALNSDDIENIFDIIAEENPDL